MIEKIKIKVEGMNLYRLVDRLVLAGVCLLNLKIKPYVLICEIDSYYFDLFKNVCKKERKDFKIVSRFGIQNVFAYTKKLLGFLPIRFPKNAAEPLTRPARLRASSE